MPLSLLLSTYVPPTYSFIRFLQIDDQYQLYAEYLVFLSTLNNKYRMFIEYANTSITLSKKWNTVRNIIYKSYLKDNYQECLSMLLKEVEQIRDISIALKTNVIRCITSIQVKRPFQIFRQGGMA